MLSLCKGVWHNPRIIKQKQYIPKYALTLANLIRNDYKLPDLKTTNVYADCQRLKEFYVSPKLARRTYSIESPLDILGAP